MSKSDSLGFTTRRISTLRYLWAWHDPLAFLAKLAAWPGDVAHAEIGQHSMIVLKHPDLIQQLLVGDAEQIEKGRPAERARFFSFLGKGLLTTEGEPHHRLRRLLLPGFHRRRLAGYGDDMVAESLALGRSWHDGELRDIGAAMKTLTLAVVGRTLLSSEVEGTAHTIARAFTELSESINRMTFPGASWVLRLPLPFARRIQASQCRLDEIVYALIKNRRAQNEDKGDLLSTFLTAEDADHAGERMSDKEVRDQVMTLFFAGFETTANALTWTWWLLAQHPDIEASLHDEIARVLGDREPRFDDVPHLLVTEQIVREVLRLYPPVWSMARRTLGDLAYNGCHVPRGSLVFCSQWLIHRDARWFPEPTAFRPDRWTPAFCATLPRFAYFPFGGGQRSCIGENFAWTEFVLIVATLARRWRFCLTPEALEVRPTARVTLNPDREVRMRLHRRDRS